MPGPLDPAPFVDACRAAGFAAAGIARCEPAGRSDSLRAWLDAGQHGTMRWMERHVEERIDPRRLLAGSRSIICVADRYHPPGRNGVEHDPAVAAYARGRDYHREMKQRLHVLCDAWAAQWPDESFRACVDTAPILERAHAESAGIGRVGKNTMLIDPGLGSWMLLGEVLTTMEIRATPGTSTDPCGTCTKCIDACPTGALRPWSVDANRCIAALTIEQREAIPAELHAGIGAWLFGCDECQTACPHNALTSATSEAKVNDAYAPRHGDLDVARVLEWTQDERVDAIAGTAMTRATLDMWRRNACIVAGTYLARGQRADLRDRLRDLAADPSEPDMIRTTAAAALARGSIAM